MQNFALLSNLQAARAISSELSDFDKIVLAQEMCADVRDPRLGIKMQKASNQIGRQADALMRSKVSYHQFSNTPADRSGSDIVSPFDNDHCPSVSEFPTSSHASVGDVPNRSLSGVSRWGRIKAWNQRLEDSWLGDCIAVVCLFGAIFGGYIFWGVIL
jgi:hypothetical protein